MGILSMESQPHILVCPAYKELRSSKSLSSIEDLTDYYAEVLRIRDKLWFNSLVDPAYAS